MDVNERRVIGRRFREAREKLGMDRPALAARLGVHAGSIARWETGGSVPLPYHLERMAEWAEVDLAWLRGGAERTARAAPAAPPADAVDLFASLDAMARFVEGIGPPGEERLRKVDALEGLRRMLTARGLLPDWWYALRDRVEADEI
jgi:transcriptional regulator with XRE-family HTH domain